MLEEILRIHLTAMGLPHDETLLERFRAYYQFLSEKNQVMNLTAISGEEKTARLHFLDSAVPLCRFSMDGAKVIDVGSGAGFPGVVLKLLCPSMRLTLLDSQRKRIGFLTELCSLLELEQVECIHARAEEIGFLRERFDFAVSRAVARMNILSELCLPYVRPGGMFLALKGPAAAEELTEAEHAIPLLGAAVEEVFAESIPGDDLRHTLVAVRKTRSTPQGYPRPFSQIKKSPL